MTTTGRPPRRGTRACVTAYFDVQPFRTGVPDGRVARTGFWLSLFRFQGATGHAPVLPVVVPGGPKDCSGQIAPLESLLRRSEGLGRPFRRDAHRIRPPCHRQRVSCRRGETGSGRLERPSADPPASHVGSIRCLALILAGEPGRTRGSLRGCGRLTVPRQDLDAVPLRRWTPVPPRGVGRPLGPLLHRPWRAKSRLDPSHATRRSKLNGLSAPPIPSPWDRPGERAPPADLLDLPLVCELLASA